MSSAPKHIVQSVTGPLAAADLGVTLAHEHLLLDGRLGFQEPTEASRLAFAYRPVSIDILHELRHNPYGNRDNCGLYDEDAAAEEVAQFARYGGKTVMEATCLGIGRDPLALRRVSVRTGLNVIMGTGFYLQRTHPAVVGESSVDELADMMMADLSDGVGDAKIRAGYIGELGTGSPVHPDEAKVVRAGARAQAATGVALSIHLDGWAREGHHVLDLIEAEGGDLSRTILCHMNPSHHDPDYQHSLADRGAYLEYDMIGLDYYFANQDAQSPSDEQAAVAIAKLIDNGYAERILLSQDVFLKMMLTRYGGNGYAHIPRHFVPRLRRHDVSEQAIHTMLVTNPASVLTGITTDAL